MHFLLTDFCHHHDIFKPEEFGHLSSDNPCQRRVLPAYTPSHLILAGLLPDSGGRERESYQGELFERAAVAVYGGRLSGGHLGDLWRGQFDLGKANFQPFPHNAQLQDKCGAGWHSAEELEITGYLGDLRHLPTQLGTGGGRRVRDEEERNHEETETNAESEKKEGEESQLISESFSFTEADGTAQKNEALNLPIWLQPLLFTVWGSAKCCRLHLMGCFTPCWPGTHRVTTGISIWAVSGSVKHLKWRVEQSSAFHRAMDPNSDPTSSQ